jgi:phenylacetate-coenzyme A ligase PaaK-like adenylate-forming protein
LDTFKSFASEIYKLNDQEFTDIALQTFRYQAGNNPIYREYIHHLGVEPSSVFGLNDIPFLPISFFKSHTIKTGNWNNETVFTSSGTTQAQTSRHEVRSLEHYLQHSKRCFNHFFGRVEDFHFLALLPSYLERSGSSLIAMMKYFIEESGSPLSGFYLHDPEKLLRDLISAKQYSKRTILWGVSFALLDFAEQYDVDLSHCIIIETGGMKGRRKEITRQELHDVLKKQFNVTGICSEYGMTEMLSQAYSQGGNRFKCPPSMRVIGRDISDPLTKGVLNENVGLNVVDLANFETISFIETEDMGKIYDDSSFEVMGRIDNSDVRGCNLLI